MPAIQPAAAAVTTTLVVPALALALAACSASHGPSSTRSGVPRSGSPNSGNSSSSASAVAYSACMRSNGVPNYPDPDSAGNLPKGDAQSFGVSAMRLQTAQRACRSLLPTAGALQDQAQQCSLTGDCPPALVQQMLSGGRVVAQCMRAHGIPRWPDPTINANGSPYFDVSGEGLTRAYTHSSQVEAIANNCGDQPGAVSLPMG